MNTALSPRDEATGLMPDPVHRKVWAYFDRAAEVHGVEWPIHYRLPVEERLAALRGLGVIAFAPLFYAHKPDMAAWLNEWALEFAAEVPEAVPTGTIFPEPSSGPIWTMRCGPGSVA